MEVDNEPRGAVFADDHTHRLYLWRRWNKQGPWVMFIGLNPSTADERRDDPTVRRCIGFAKRWECGGIFMCNVFTLVSTDPKKLNVETPIAMGASLAMRVIRERCSKAVAGWGNLITQVREGEDQVERIKRQLSPLDCLGMTKLGHPRHPLYLPYSVKLVTFCV
ncbi:DUF1643 domain-containing protein [Patescibacteria group bacterium]|nr:DUF1643 domain-containing protein [Patescibacteria group bacterium]